MGGGMPNGDQLFFLMSRNSTWNLIADVCSSGGNKGHETNQLLYKKDSHIAPWEEEGHKCKNNITGTLAIKALKEAIGVFHV